MYDSSAFVVHPANQAFLERKADYPANLNNRTELELGCVLLFLVPFVLLGIFGLAISVNPMHGHIMIAQNSITGEGWVEEREIEHNDGRLLYYLRYAFYVDEQIYRRKHAVSETVYESYQRDDRIEIIYAVDDPTISYPTEANSLGSDIGIFLISLVWTGIGCLFTYWMLQAQRKRQKLRKNGQLVRGKIAQIQGEIDDDGNYYIYLTVVFRAPDTALNITQMRSYLRNYLKNRLLPPEGTPIYIFYLDATVWEVL